MRAFIVVDLGFGDAGKGLLTDFLARRYSAGLVVRYNGGAQAGHNVVAPDGRHHTFAQFGAGTFLPGVKTFLSRHVVVHPAALLVEGDILVRKGVDDAFERIRISADALVITPFHQAANRIRELARGQLRHGSCGVGVGEAVEDALQHADSIRVGDLSHGDTLRQKLFAVRARKRDQMAPLLNDLKSDPAVIREWEIFTREEVIENWIDQIARIATLELPAPDALLARWLQQAENVVFEGAQGVLLDADAGFHPYTTWSCCTTANAFSLLAEYAPAAEVCQVGVLRAYALRHGPGPLPTGTDALTPAVLDHNQANAWQGPVRYGWFDGVLARYALAVNGGVDALCVTHMDILPRLEEWKFCPAYLWQPMFEGVAGLHGSGGLLAEINLLGDLSLAQRERFSRALCEASPLLEGCAPEPGQVIAKIEALTGQKVGFASVGPSATNVTVTQ